MSAYRHAHTRMPTGFPPECPTGKKHLQLLSCSRIQVQFLSQSMRKFSSSVFPIRAFSFGSQLAPSFLPKHQIGILSLHDRRNQSYQQPHPYLYVFHRIDVIFCLCANEVTLNKLTMQGKRKVSKKISKNAVLLQRERKAFHINHYPVNNRYFQRLLQQKNQQSGKVYLTPMTVYEGDTIPYVKLPTVYIFKPLKFKNKKHARNTTNWCAMSRRFCPLPKKSI